MVSHSAKILTYIIKTRIKTKIQQKLDDDQCGFRPGIGTMEVKPALITCYKVEYFVLHDKDIYLAFIYLKNSLISSMEEIFQ